MIAKTTQRTMRTKSKKTATKATKSAGKKLTEAQRERQALRLRAEQIVHRELAFIDNPGFREMEQSKAKEPELPLGAAPSLPSHVARDMPAHLARLCEVKLLTPQQEVDLFCWLNYYKYRANALRSQLNPKRPSRKKIDNIELWVERANQIRNHIIRSNTRLVISIVKKAADEKNPFDELLSEGISCLIRVVDKFDFDRGFRFSTYATRAVQREVWRLIQRNHRDRQRWATGISDTFDHSESRELADRIDELTWKRLTHEMGEILQLLDDREAHIVRERFGMNSAGKKRTFQSLGEELGVCKERVRQLEIRAMKKLHGAARELGMHKLEV